MAAVPRQAELKMHRMEFGTKAGVGASCHVKEEAAMRQVKVTLPGHRGYSPSTTLSAGPVGLSK